MGKSKLNNEVIDQRLIDFNRDIKRLENYPGSNRIHMKWECTVKDCGHIWDADCDHILNSGRGCPRCAGNIPLDNNIVDQRLKNRNIKRLNGYINAKTKIKWQCLICNHIWETTTTHLLNNKTECPDCANQLPLTDALIDTRLIGRDIKRLDNCKNAITKIRWQCLICNRIWEAIPANILNKKSGCSRCSDNEKLTNENVDERLKNLNIKRLNDITGNKIKVNWKCLIEDCGCIWKTTPSLILNNKTGCPDCSINKNEKLVGKILLSHNIDALKRYDIRKIIFSEHKRMYVDFYIINQNIIIEYNGHQHYQPVCFGGISKDRAQQNFIKQQSRDQYLQNFCDSNNIKLIWIDGRKYTNDNLKNHLITDIIPQLINN